MNFRSIAFLSLFAVFCGAACSSNGGDAASASVASLDDYCEQLANALCDGAEACCSKPDPFEGIDCKTQAKIDCHFGHTWKVRSEDFDAQRAAAVVNKAHEAAQSCGFWEMPERSDILKLRQPAVGEACTEWQYGPESNFTCPHDSFCGYKAGVKTWVCTPSAQAGKSCGDDTPCASGLVCSSGVCEKGAAEGEACASSTACVKGLQCLPISPTKKGCTSPHVAGEACFSHNGCDSGLCVANAGSKDTGTCSACQTGDECDSGYCNEGKCLPLGYGPPKEDGAQCRYDNECASAECYDQACGLPTGDAVFCFDPMDL